MEKYKIKGMSGRWLSAVILLMACLPLTFCQRENIPPPVIPTQEKYDLQAEIQLLAETLRINILTIDVTYDFYPDQMRVNGKSRIVFNMRPGQNLALIHFDPALRSAAVDAISLDGESLSFANTQDVKIKEFSGSTQKAIEFQRPMAQNQEHNLEMTFHLLLPGSHPRFNTKVDDLTGAGNEEVFPTINSPEEMARHRIIFRAHGNRRFVCLGSGKTDEIPGAPLQEWLLDSEREISSYTVMFVLVPKEDVVFEQKTISGIPVTIMAYVGGPDIAAAWNEVNACLPEYIANIDPFPAPRLSIFLISGGGMEYYGGTFSAITALKHEIFHNYFACSAVARTYRDSWWDEALATWYDGKQKGATALPMPENAATNIVSGRSPIAMGWDYRAYEVGAQIMQAIAVQLGGSESFIRFLSYLHRHHAFSPFNAMEMADILQAYAGIDMHARFLSWLYSQETPAAAANSSQSKEANLDPPVAIMNKYLDRATSCASEQREK
jgi:hypothetical protein